MAGDVAMGVSGCESGREAAFVMGAKRGGQRDGVFGVDLHSGVF